MSRRKQRRRGGGHSKDPAAKERQLANLKKTAGPGRPPTHGAYAAITETELEGKTRTIFDALAARAPVRDTETGGLPAHDTVAVRMLAEVMVRRDRVRATELAHGLEIASGPSKGRLRGVVEYGLRLDAQALELARELGMTPKSRAALGLDLARAQRLDLAQQWAQETTAEDQAAIDGTAEDVDEAES